MFFFFNIVEIAEDAVKLTVLLTLNNVEEMTVYAC